MPLVDVDTNKAETPLYDSLCEELGGTTVGRERLDLGDVRIATEGLTILIERKSWDDWSASICDGRYKEQKARFLGSADETTRLVILIEGGLTGFDGRTRGMSNKALNAAVLKTQLRDGISVVRSRNAANTAQIVAYMAKQMEQGALNPPAAVASIGAAGSSKKRKRENLEEPDSFYRAVLGLVPGMSDEKAEVVAGAYPTMRALRRADLSDLEALECGAKCRRLGPSVAARLRQLIA